MLVQETSVQSGTQQESYAPVGRRVSKGTRPLELRVVCGRSGIACPFTTGPCGPALSPSLAPGRRGDLTLRTIQLVLADLLIPES